MTEAKVGLINASQAKASTLDVKPLSNRAVPELQATLTQLSDAVCIAHGGKTWRQRLYFAVASWILNPRQKALLGQVKTWQNDAMTTSYLNGRESLALYSNVSYLFESTPAPTSALTRAALIAQRALLFHRQIKDGTLPPEVEAGYALEREQYPYFFATARLPDYVHDHMQHWPSSQYFIVALRGQFYRVDVGDEVPPEDAILATLDRITQEKSPPLPYVGLLTALSRPSWAGARVMLNANPHNRELVNTLDKALFVLALDLETKTENRADSMRNLVIGNLHNRWFDKSHQLIITADGSAGVNRDHSFLDGHPTLRYVQFLNADSERQIKEATALTFQHLAWQIDEPISKLIDSAKASLAKQTSDFDLTVWDHHALGVDSTKSKGRVADFVMQAAIHLTCFRVFGRCLSSTEAVHMRHTTNGRYDSILTLTSEMRELVTKFDKVDAGQRQQLILAGQQAHRARIKACKEGRSPVLHLLALLNEPALRGLLMLKADGIYARWGTKLINSALTDITSCAVTTSHPGYRPGLESSGFTDTYPGVVGISYLVKSDRTTIYLKVDSDKRPMGPRLKAELDRAIDELMR